MCLIHFRPIRPKTQTKEMPKLSENLNVVKVWSRWLSELIVVILNSCYCSDVNTCQYSAKIQGVALILVAYTT